MNNDDMGMDEMGMLEEILMAADEGSKELGVSMGAMLWQTEILMEAMADHEGEPKKAAYQVARTIHYAILDRMPEAIELVDSGLRAELPKWVEIHDTAVASGENPVDALAELDGTTERMAKDRVVNVQRFKNGLTHEQLVEAGLKDLEEMDPDETELEIIDTADMIYKELLKMS